MSERFESGCLHSTTSTATANSDNSLLGMSSSRSESHVAQQSRRDKLRVPQTSTTTTTTAHQNIQDFPNYHLVNLHRYSGLSNPDVFQARSFRNCDFLCDPKVFSSDEMHSNNILLAHKDAIVNQESNSRSLGSVPPEDASFASSSHHVVPSNFISTSKVELSDSQNPYCWKGVGVQQNCDWISNFVNGSLGTGGSSNNTSPLLVGEILPRNSKEVDSSIPLYLKPGCNGGYQDVQGSEISNQKQYGEINFSTSQLINFQSNLQEVVRSSAFGSQGFGMASVVEGQKVRETGHGSWGDGGGNELVLLPTYGSNPTDEVVGSHRWNGGNFKGVVVGDSTTQSLSLSLSSHRPPPPELHSPDQFGERFGFENMQSRPGICSGSQDLRTSNNSGYLFSNHQSSTSYRGVGNSTESIGGSSTYPRSCTGPLGPFTGYATILKNSKFLKPAQQLLDEFCNVAAPERCFRDASVLSDHVNAENEVGRRDGNSGVSSSICSSKSFGEGKVGSGHCQSYHPEFQQKKAKFLYMLEEVCRRYKQYHQQMRMVISSFESVAGLDAATPYTSLALKTVSKHFRCLKNTISDQLRLIRKSLGEDMSSPTSRTSSNKGDATVQGLTFIDQNLGKQTAVGNNLGFLESQQHVWRPQRGLPERSVAVLRAWLFDHFLHPYPTDTDKHMLASQTGLTRNQVSNWFINARVRVWKPMVEEMHMLETKASSEMDLNSGKKSIIKPNVVDGSRQRVGDQCSDKLMIDAMSENGQECAMTSSVEVGPSSEQQWHQDKRSRMECQIPSGIDGSLMGFIPYHQSALEIGGLGSVSLTLGLRHSAESVQQQQQQQQQQEHQLRRHFGGEMIHDFVG